jgi:hypothetical protein
VAARRSQKFAPAQSGALAVFAPFFKFKKAGSLSKKLQIVYKTAARGLLLKRGSQGLKGKKRRDTLSLAGWLRQRGQVLCREQKRASERHHFDSITRAPRALFHPFFERADCMRALSFGLAQNYHHSSAAFFALARSHFLRWAARPLPRLAKNTHPRREREF